MKLFFSLLTFGLIFSSLTFANDLKLTSIYNSTHKNIMLEYVVCTNNVCDVTQRELEINGWPNFTIWLEPNQIIKVNKATEWEYERNKPWPGGASGIFNQCIGQPGGTLNLEIDKYAPMVIQCKIWY